MERCSSHDGINGKLNWCLAIITFSVVIFLPLFGWLLKETHNTSKSVAVISSYYASPLTETTKPKMGFVMNFIETKKEKVN